MGRKQGKSRAISLDQPLLAKPVTVNFSDSKAGFGDVSKVKRVRQEHG